MLAAGMPPEECADARRKDRLDKLLFCHHGFVPGIARLVPKLEGLQGDGAGAPPSACTYLAIGRAGPDDGGNAL